MERGEHTDYGLITILAQDASGGSPCGHPTDGSTSRRSPTRSSSTSGDMLERMTGGYYKSTPHRVRNTSADRLSFPLFLDPAWDAEVLPVPNSVHERPTTATTAGTVRACTSGRVRTATTS